MGLVTVFAVFLLAALITFKTKEDFFDTFPMVISGFVLVLYVLAFAGALRLVDWIALGIVLFACAWGVSILRKGDKACLVSFCKELFAPKSWVLFLFMGIITWLVKDKIALWWDDINYWAVDAKALYYNNGFAGKYGNVAPEFGDYPPAIQLFKWFFLHLSPTFKEGLMFAGYYCMNLIYTLPLLARLKTKNPLYILAGLTGAFLLPGVIDGMSFQGTCADVTMGLVYGAFLWAVMDEKGHSQVFTFVRRALYLCVLVLTKSVGIEWAFFGFVFFVFVYARQLKEQGLLLKNKIKYVLLLGGMCAVTEGSWLLFCLRGRRVAKLTGAGVRIALDGNFTLPEDTMVKMGHFLRGFAFYPMHMDRTLGVDLSSLGLLLLVVVLIFTYYKMGLFVKWEFRTVSLFAVLTAVASYGIIFLGHLTIFAGELQYLDDAIMARSIARYGAPFAVGMIYLLMGSLTARKNMRFAYGACLVAVVFTTSLPGTYHALYGYRQTVKKDYADRELMVEADARLFIEKAARLQETLDRELFETRTLYLRDDKTIHWIKDTYISYAASPIPVVYGGIATDTMTGEDMEKRIRESHAKYLYSDRVDGNPAALFKDMLTDETFEYETFYEIENDGNNLRLVKLQ